MKVFETVGVVARDRTVGDSLVAVEQALAGHGTTMVMEERTATMLPNGSHDVVPRIELGRRCDLIIVVGGDGSLLGVARDLAGSGVPVTGINRGSLGFLADISPEQIEEKLGEVLDGRYIVQQRFLLNAEVRRAGASPQSSSALNDVVVHPGTMSRMMEFSLFVNDQFVYEQRSDGLIVASPTGSTAYALSAGGPIMHPNLDAIVVVPMFPHTLTSRPLVIPGGDEIKVVIGKTSSPNPQISCDSQVDIDIQSGDEVVIGKHAQTLALLYPLGHDFYEACRSKLDWASRLGGSRG
jgi:NAD+ kinase